MLFNSIAAVAGLVSIAQAKALAYDPGFSPTDLVDTPHDGGWSDPTHVDVCIGIYLSTHAVAYPVVINQFFGDNTNIVINGGITFQITNAPTSVSTTITVTTTTTSTTTVNPGTALQTPIVISISSGPLGKRDGASYLGAGGAIVGSCGKAALFTTNASGQIFSGGEQISANTGDSEVLVATSAAIGDITTFFSGNGGFSWTNDAFFGGAAHFCSKGAYLWAEFTEDIPAGCNALVLSAVPASACDDTTSSSISTTFSTVSSSTYSYSNTSTIAV